MSEIEDLRRTYRPKRITTLFVGESVPAGGTFFYKGDSDLFSEMRRVFAGSDDFLDDFKRKGFYLDDLVLWPVNKLKAHDKKAAYFVSVKPLSERISDYRPTELVVIGRGIKKWVGDAASLAKFIGPLFDVPFPGRWPRNTKTFHTEMSAIIKLLTINRSDVIG